MKNMLTINATVIMALAGIYTEQELTTLKNTVDGYNGKNPQYKTTATADDIVTNLNKAVAERFYKTKDIVKCAEVIPVFAVAVHSIECIDDITVTAHKIPSISRLIDSDKKDDIIEVATATYDGIKSRAYAIQKAVGINDKVVHKEFKYVAKNIHNKLTANADKEQYADKLDKAGFFKDLSNAYHIVKSRFNYKDLTENKEIDEKIEHIDD